MKKTLTFLLVLGLIAGAMAMPAHAKKKPKKVQTKETGDYQSPQLVVLGSCSASGAIGCVEFTVPSKSQRFVSVEITDQSGLPVSASIQQPTGPVNAGVQQDEPVGSFCGKTKSPVAVDPGYTVHVWVDDTPNPSCAPALATSGTITATFTNIP